MSKILFFFLLIIISLIYIFNIDKFFSDRFIFINQFKESYFRTLSSTNSGISKYFNQANTISSLEEEIIELRQFKVLYVDIRQKMLELEALNLPISGNYSNIIKATKIISYVNFDDFTKVWLDASKTDEKIQGLILDNYAAGIVVNRANKALALLNGNSKANYTVYIGKNKAPGIVHNHKTHYLKVKFIPIWIDLNVGDEVITSGMDNIFFEGLKVGKVISIKKMADMQEAIIKPYAKVLQNKYFYIY